MMTTIYKMSFLSRHRMFLRYYKTKHAENADFCNFSSRHVSPPRRMHARILPLHPADHDGSNISTVSELRIGPTVRALRPAVYPRQTLLVDLVLDISAGKYGLVSTGNVMSSLGTMLLVS